MLTEEQLFRVGNFDNDTINNLREALGGGIESISAAGALSQAFFETQLTVSGTVAYTLAAPTVAGPKKRVVCAAAASTPVGTLTVSSPDDATDFVTNAVFTFHTAGQAVEFVATAALKWRAVRITRAGTQAVVIGTTTLTNLNLAAVYSLSVTGTVSSTGVRALPPGSAIGEQTSLAVTTAASTPAGSIAFTGVNQAGTAATTVTGMDATTDNLLLQWAGSTTGWQPVFVVGLAFT